jgi:hypothetical protein
MRKREVLRFLVIIIFSLVTGTAQYPVFADDGASLFSVSPGTVENMNESTGGDDYETAYQVGAFRKIENAELFTKILLLQGFYGEIRKKNVAESGLWVVTVAKEQNPFIDREKELRDAGYSPFPVKVVYK